MAANERFGFFLFIAAFPVGLPVLMVASQLIAG